MATLRIRITTVPLVILGPFVHEWIISSLAVVMFPFVHSCAFISLCFKNCFRNASLRWWCADSCVAFPINQVTRFFAGPWVVRFIFLSCVVSFFPFKEIKIDPIVDRLQYPPVVKQNYGTSPFSTGKIHYLTISSHFQ